MTLVASGGWSHALDHDLIDSQVIYLAVVIGISSDLDFSWCSKVVPNNLRCGNISGEYGHEAQEDGEQLLGLVTESTRR